MSETWLSFREAVALVRDRIGASIGYAEALVMRARKSGEGVRIKRAPVLLGADDGLTNFNFKAILAGAADGMNDPPGGMSEADLLDWLRRNVPKNGKGGDPSKRKRVQPMRDEGRKAIAGAFPDGMPNRAELPDKRFCDRARQWYDADRAKRGVPFIKLHDDAILRAADRKK
jgi:hypothetical protein